MINIYIIYLQYGCTRAHEKCNIIRLENCNNHIKPILFAFSRLGQVLAHQYKNSRNIDETFSNNDKCLYVVWPVLVAIRYKSLGFMKFERLCPKMANRSYSVIDARAQSL